MTELKPCPFCSSDNLFQSAYDCIRNYVWCIGCDARGPLFTDINQAAAAWNKRAKEGEGEKLA